MNISTQQINTQVNSMTNHKHQDKSIAPNILFPPMAPIWLITVAITPVANPRASKREYDNISLK